MSHIGSDVDGSDENLWMGRVARQVVHSIPARLHHAGPPSPHSWS